MKRSRIYEQIQREIYIQHDYPCCSIETRV